jgi:hypothetical protein
VAVEDVSALVATHGVHARKIRALISSLSSSPLEELIRQSALPRRTVEELLQAAQGVPPEELAALSTVPSPARSSTVEAIEADIAAAPPPLRALDHVPATADTVSRRAHWLEETYELTAGRLLCLGDHDLTSLAVAALRPEAEITVVDLDERLLEFIDTRARQRGLRIRCLHADLRFGLPSAAAGSADLVFTDPPYTPEGMALFLARGIECLREPIDGRLIVAYGYSQRNPTLGLQVQRAVQRLDIVFEAILPGFNRYVGAQAVGSASDLYVCRPTKRPGKTAGRTGIYTHGPQSVEASASAPTEALREYGEPQQPGWQEPLRGTAFDLSADPGPWLLRTLLATSAPEVAVLVSNNHPDIVDEQSQLALADLLKAKYQLRFRRSTPDNKHALVVATAVEEPSVARYILEHAHGKLGNIWRDALIQDSGGTLTKREARDQITADSDDLTARVIDLPRHRLKMLL